MNGFPTALVGPGSQPEDFDGSKLEYMKMPSGMITFSAAHIPSPEQAVDHAEAMKVTRQLQALLDRCAATGETGMVDLTHLEPSDIAFIDELLGEGEVSVVCGGKAQAQESVLAGVWRVRSFDADGTRAGDTIEVGAFPKELLSQAFNNAADAAQLPQEGGPNIFNAPALITEINEFVPRARQEGAEPHVINLSLLPHTEEDLAFLDKVLGSGDLVILSRGYGNCRIMATTTRDTWWVRYYNSQDTLILNSIEISEIPVVALAAAEDIVDSAERLAEIMEIYQ